jgi:hypothetical protein
MTAFAGLDTSAFPGLPTMAWLRKNTNLCWTGFYLKSPSHHTADWMAQRSALVAQGWELAPIYVGQQVTGPGSHVVTAAQGQIDGNDAAAQMQSAAFPLGSFVFLDLENGPPFSLEQESYVDAWCDAVMRNGFGAGIYCSYLIAAEVHAARPSARLWAFRVRTTTLHDGGASPYPTPDPSASGYADTTMWQHDDEARISTGGGAYLTVDLNTSLLADPSAPLTTENKPMTISAGDIAGLQTALNQFGASPPLTVDGQNGPLTQAAVSAFQTKWGLPVTGTADAATLSAINANLETGATVTDTPAPATAATVSPAAIATAASATTPTVAVKADVPSVTQTSLVDASTAIDSIVALLEGKLDPLADAAQATVLGEVPFIGAMLEEIAPHAASDALNVAITQGAALFKSTGNPLYTDAAYLIPAAEQIFTSTSGWLSTLGLTGLVSGLIGKAAAAVGLTKAA